MTTCTVKYQDYNAPVQPTWCGGCGDYGIWAALKMALVELNIAPHEVVLCFDIGCNGNMNDKIAGYRIHGLHGRVLPVATAAKIANPNMIVIASGGDGATYSEGVGHFIHTLRNEYPITFLVHDNENYGLTTGQSSSTTRQDIPMNASPDGNSGKTMNPLELALSLDPSFMAQGFAGDMKRLTEILKLAILHQKENRGTGFVNILQPCPTYNRTTTQSWYMERIKNVADEHDVTNKDAARILAQKTSQDIPIGVLYKNPEAKCYLDRLTYRTSGKTIVEEVGRCDVTPILEEFR
jgi:2-oxoglutarate ferredoxin oxidoreductase subunit beta